MSYWCTMRFAKAETIEEALTIAYKAQKSVTQDSVEKAIASNATYMERVESKDIGFYLEHLLKLHFSYLAEKKLLMLYSCNINFDFEAVGFGKSVEFQNSCDQDYEYSHWEGLHGLYDELIEKAKNLDAKSLQLSDEDYLDYTTKELEENLDYHRKSYVYDQIYKDLGISDWLYETETDKSEPITLSIIHRQMQKHKYENIAKVVMIIYEDYFSSEKTFKEYRYFEDYYRYVMSDDKVYKAIIEKNFEQEKIRIENKVAAKKENKEK